MYQHAISLVSPSIFPIFFESKDGDQRSLGVSGTGFFINADGYFLTAAHVISECPPQSRQLFVGCTPSHVLETPLEIEEIFFNAAEDVFIGKVNFESPSFLTLADSAPRPGCSLCLCGYPLARLALEYGVVQVRNVRQYWQPTHMVDLYTITNEDKGQRYLSFITQHASFRGMSGGPVFTQEGRVVGMDVASLARRIPEPEGDPTVVTNGVVLHLDILRAGTESI